MPASPDLPTPPSPESGGPAAPGPEGAKPGPAAGNLPEGQGAKFWQWATSKIKPGEPRTPQGAMIPEKVDVFQHPPTGAEAGGGAARPANPVQAGPGSPYTYQEEQGPAVIPLEGAGTQGSFTKERFIEQSDRARGLYDKLTQKPTNDADQLQPGVEATRAGFGRLEQITRRIQELEGQPYDRREAGQFAAAFREWLEAVPVSAQEKEAAIEAVERSNEAAKAAGERRGAVQGAVGAIGEILRNPDFQGVFPPESGIWKLSPEERSWLFDKMVPSREPGESKPAISPTSSTGTEQRREEEVGQEPETYWRAGDQPGYFEVTASTPGEFARAEESFLEAIIEMTRGSILYGGISSEEIGTLVNNFRAALESQLNKQVQSGNLTPEAADRQRTIFQARLVEEAADNIGGEQNPPQSPAGGTTPGK